ncbi:MAG: CapA family protein [Gammaproteobacteria bacterium]|nr:CapA family protein [Gammaproteobacteria bacterium]
MILAWSCALVASAQEQVLSVAAAGDIMLGTNYPENRLPDDDGASFLAAVAPVLQAADVAIGNLEGVILDGGEPAKTCANPDACFLFRSPPRYAGLLRAAGFDVLSLANNHARDFGEDGRTATMAVLDDYDLRHSGRRGDIASWQQNGLRLAFIAFSPTRLSYLLNDIPTAMQEVAALAAAHDIVIVSFHGGAEGPAAMDLPFEEEFYFGETRGEVVRFARAVIDVGADLVIGHGPHVPRAMELYRDRLVAYSLGNFATYYGVSVAGVAGVAPLLVVDVAPDGRFLSGRIRSAVQIRPGGPVWDTQQRALELIRDLTERSFGTVLFEFDADGGFTAAATLPQQLGSFEYFSPQP